MLIRASIVLLIVLNLGVAAWWLAGPATPPRDPALQPEGVPRLQLLHERAEAPANTGTVAAVPDTRAQSAAAGEVGVVAAAPLCFSVGPFDAEAAAVAAAERLRNVVASTRTRSVPATGASAYSVFLPPAPDRAQAQAAAERIGAAGFDDFLVVNTGEMANSVALGRYGSLAVAERRQASLLAAGFPAQVSAVGARTPAQWWLDARAPREFTRQNAQALVGAAESQELECGLLL